MTTETILITGATGNIGTALTHLLASHPSQPQVRVATRSVQSPAAQLLRLMNPATVQSVAFDLADPASLRAALDGVTKLCVIAPFGTDMGAWHEQLMAAVVVAGSCEYVVKVSVTGARAPNSDPPPGGIPLGHWRGEDAIRRSGIAATMIRPTIFMQHFLTVPGLFTPGEAAFYLPTGAQGVAFVDCRDIAAVAAQLLTAEQSRRQPFEGQAFDLTGPAAVTAAEIAAALSAAAERPLAHVDGAAAFTAHCQALGVADGIKAVYAEAAEGWFAALSTAEFQQLTGWLPTSFAKFAYDHAEVFRPAAS